MEEVRKDNMAAQFDLLWVSVRDESIQERLNRYTCSGWTFVPYKIYPFGNKYHTIACALFIVICRVDIVEGEGSAAGYGAEGV